MYLPRNFPGSCGSINIALVLVVNNPAASVADARDPGSVPGLGRSSGEGNGNPLQYSCLENPMDRGAWWATVFGVAKESDTTEHLAAAAARQALAGLPASSWGTFHSWGFHPRDLRPPPPPPLWALGTDKPDPHPASRLSTSWRGGALGRHKGVCRGLCQQFPLKANYE